MTAVKGQRGSGGESPAGKSLSHIDFDRPPSGGLLLQHDDLPPSGGLLAPHDVLFVFSCSLI